MKKGANVFGLIAILMIIGSAFVGVVSAEEIIIDTEIDESSFTVYPSRPIIGWYLIRDHDTFHTRAYDGNFWYTLCGEEGHGDPLYYGLWQASLPQSGDYEVFVWIPDPDPFVEDWQPQRRYTPTQSAVYQIYHKAGRTTKTVNQELKTGGFYSLGTFNFDTLASVILNDRTGESYLSTMIAFDAVKFVPVAAPNTLPYIPSNPSPATHATGQSIHTDLSWTGGDPDAGDTVTYDVYFGTSTRSLKVSTAQSGTTYDPGTLSYSTYYWRIVATDNHGASTTGPLWDFTTGSTPNTPPYTPSNPSPATHATGQSIHTDLSWTGGDPDAGDTVTYDVYFGTSTRSLKVSTAQSGTTYDPGTLNTNTKYYWKIEATDNHGASTTSPLWDFTTGSAPTCAIELRKNGAEIDEIDVGEFFDIYVGDSTDDTGIKDVRFSSDDSQDDIPTGAWTEWYNWDTHLEDWNPETKIKHWTCATAGEKEVWVEVRDGDEEVSQCHADIFVHPGYAIIVAGEGRRICDFPLIVDKKAIDHNANNAHRVLRNSGFDDDHIFYLNSNRPQNIDADEDDEVDAPAFFSDFESTINEVRNKIGDNPTPLILYFKGHGLPSQFIFSFIFEDSLEVYKLKDELDKFSSEIPMLIVVDSCYSGSFINPLIGISAPNRVIITTTHADQERSWVGCLHSSDRLWGNLNKGLNVKEAFTTNILSPVGMAGALFTSDIHYLLLDDNGDGRGHPPNDLGTDGNLAARTQIGVPDTENLKLIDWLFVGLGSPGELRVYDTENRVTGLVSGEVKEEIPDSIYDEENEIVAIFSPSDTYRYEVVGTDKETYGLDIASIEGAEATTFTATDIPTTPRAIHQYTIDWAALSQGEKGVTVKIDSNGNGTFERTIITNNSFHPLIAQFTFSPENPLIGEKVTLDASTSFDLGGGVIKKYRWEFYNAANQDPFYVIEGRDKEIIRYTFTSEGIYLVRLTVTDDEGEYSYTESSITIKEPVFYVPDDYPSIQAAVDAANAGDTIIVRDGTYSGNVDIDKSITLKSSSENPGNTIVQAANPNDHVFEITADYVNISGFTVGGVAECCKAVIFLNEVNYCNISNNHILNYTGISGEGLLLDSSNSNTVFNNTFSGYNLYSLGIRLMNSTNNLISDNTICNCPHGGIELGLVSSNNIILNNTFKSCGLCVWRYEKNTVKGNTVNDKPLIYLENVSQIEVNNAGQVILANCERIKVIGCNLSNATIGIDLLNSSNCVIENNICRDNFCGGIDLFDYSSNNIVLNNTIENNFWGILLTSYASNNTIVNNICENNYFGIHLSDTNNNRIYLNNLNNDCNVQSYNSCNIWNSKEKITYSYNGESHTNYRGNYWSDYTGTDANKNGIGDSPYSIDDRGGDIDQDYYPLMTWSEHYFNPSPTIPTPPTPVTPSPLPKSNYTFSLHGDVTLLWSYVNEERDAEIDFDLINDVNGDGIKDVLIFNYDSINKLLLISGKDGSILWSKSMPVMIGLDALSDDANGDGIEDIIINKETNENSLIVELVSGLDGSEIWRKNVDGYDRAHGIFRDLNGDGIEDILLEDHEYHYPNYRCEICTLSANDGSKLWNKTFEGNVHSGCYCFQDVTGDSIYDFIISIYNKSTNIGELFAIRGSDGYVEWHKSFTGDPGWVFLKYDFDGDGLVDLNLEIHDSNNKTTKVLVLKGSDGSIIWSKLYNFYAHGYGLDDINADGRADLCLELENFTTRCAIEVQVLSGRDGSLIWNKKVNGFDVGTCSDLNKDGNNDFLLVNSTEIAKNTYLYDVIAICGINWSEIWEKSFRHDYSADIPEDAPKRVIFYGTADLNGDEIEDILLEMFCDYYNETVDYTEYSVFVINGKNGSVLWNVKYTLDEQRRYSSGLNTWDEFNNDGINDVLLRTKKGVYLLATTPRPTHTPPPTPTPTPTPTPIPTIFTGKALAYVYILD